MNINREPAGTPTGGQFAAGSNAESAVQLDVAGGHSEAPTTVSEVTDEHLRDAMEAYLKATCDYRDFDAWAEELDYEDDDFGDSIWQSTQAMQHAGLPGTHSAVCTPDSNEYGASVDIGVYDEVNGRHCTRFANQYEFWNESGEPSDRAAHLLRRTYESIAGEQGTVDAQRERDTRLATMQRSMAWEILPIERQDAMQVRKGTLQAAYPGLSDDEALVGSVKLLAARDEIERRELLSELQATSDERDTDLATSQDAFVGVMSEAGIYKRSVAGFVGANLRTDEIDKVSYEESDEQSLRTFWTRARLATGRAAY